VSRVLLDTCALIWLANREPMASSAIDAILSAGAGDGVCVSPISAWEIGLLSRPRADRPPLYRFLPDAKTWIARALDHPGVELAAMTAEIAFDSSHLPGDFHPDPADRIIVATARHLGAPVVTRDRKILDYAAQGHVAVIAC
jgi:PIN domain nuclease of toxin-antitoxin system